MVTCAFLQDRSREDPLLLMQTQDRETTKIMEGEADGWRQHIRQKMEEELERRVREALDTPPLERQRRAREQAQRNRVDDCEEMNAHLDLVEKDRETASARRQRLRLVHSREIDSRLHFRRLIEPVTLPNMLQQFPGDYYESTASLLERIHSERVEERSSYYFDSDDISYEDNDELSIARSGVSLPPGFRLLVPAPEFITSIPSIPEPLSVGQEGPDLFDSQCTPFTHKWRGICIVFDSEKWPKDQQPIPISNPLVAPNLTFESRFETGNLRQARRVGQFEYELLLKTDLYTKRHTQWYYFRLQNMVPCVTYKFRIVNFLKKDSLYNYGMKPLFYSEADAKSKNVGWIRKGHHIRYSMNMEHLASPLLSRDLTYYELEWQVEFPNGGDSCYFAHCYPYTFTDLKSDLDAIMADPKRNGVTKREVMCETRAGNSCFLVTVTNFDVKTLKRCVVVSARVHPGETNASWMMKGLLDFITGPDWRAEELRRKFVFKIVPMLNPDGVIIGNYRCGLAGKDLNRNYRHPRRESFPTVACTKNMIVQMQSKMEVLIYCDLHGHSRKSNVFMYGCNSPESMAGDVRAFLDERIFPFLVAKHAPEAFSFSSCKFQIKRCKESTGRVVMYRQMKIKNSFTLESTFSGTIIDKSGSRHFNQRDFQDIGKVFCLGVHEYAHVLDDKQKESEVVLDLAREIAHQVLQLRGFKTTVTSNDEQASEKNTHCPDVDMCQHLDATEGTADQEADTGKLEGNDATTELKSLTPTLSDDFGFHEASQAANANETSQSNEAKNLQTDLASGKEQPQSSQGADDSWNVEGNSRSSDQRLKILAAFDSLSENTIQECLGLLGELDFDLKKLESDSSSDSDSESDPEVKVSKPKTKKKKKRSKQRKQKKARSRSSSGQRRPLAAQVPAQSSWDCSTIPASGPSEPVSRPFVLPTIGTSAADKENKLAMQDKDSQKTTDKYTKSYQWTNPYTGRSNGGIPCYSEERSLERAAKRINELRLKAGEAGLQVYHSGAVTWPERADDAPHEERRHSDALGSGSGDIDDDYYQQWLSFHFERERTQELLRWSLQTLADSYAPLPKVTYQHAVTAEADASSRRTPANTRTTANEHGFYSRFMPPPPPPLLRHSGTGPSGCCTYTEWIDPLACSLITLGALHSPYGNAVDTFALQPACGSCRSNNTAAAETMEGSRSGGCLQRMHRAPSDPTDMRSSSDVLSTVGLRRQIVNQSSIQMGIGNIPTPSRKQSWRLKYAATGDPPNLKTGAPTGQGDAQARHPKHGGHLTPLSMSAPASHGELPFRAPPSAAGPAMVVNAIEQSNPKSDQFRSLPPVPSSSKQQPSKLTSRDYSEMLNGHLKQQQQQQMLAVQADMTAKSELLRSYSRLN